MRSVSNFLLIIINYLNIFIIFWFILFLFLFLWNIFSMDLDISGIATLSESDSRRFRYVRCRNRGRNRETKALEGEQTRTGWKGEKDGWKKELIATSGDDFLFYRGRFKIKGAVIFGTCKIRLVDSVIHSIEWS